MFMQSSQSFTRTARPVRFGAGASKLRALPGQGLTLEEVRRAAPAVFAEGAHESRSDRFVTIPTAQALAPMLAEGFQIVEVAQGGTRDETRRGYTKHAVRLRHLSAGSVMTLGNLSPEIILTNGNDGSSAYWLEAGLYRLVCLNGLRVADRQFEPQRVAHRGRPDQVVDDVIDAAFRVVESLPAAIDAAGAMEAVQLAPAERVAFANAALQLRWAGEEAGEPAPIQADDALRARRVDDRGADLWRTMNVVQEGLIRGGQRYRARPTEANPFGQRRTVGEVRGLDQDRAINRALWTLATEMQRLKTAA